MDSELNIHDCALVIKNTWSLSSRKTRKKFKEWGIESKDGSTCCIKREEAFGMSTLHPNLQIVDPKKWMLFVLRYCNQPPIN